MVPPAARRLGYPAVPREVDGKLFVSDNGNHILDCKAPLLRNPSAVEEMLRAIPGIVGTGLFLGMAHTALVDNNGRIEIRHARPPDWPDLISPRTVPSRRDESRIARPRSIGPATRRRPPVL